MKKIGVFKEFDGLGRIVIPKELRERYGVDGRVEIIAMKEGVLNTNPRYELVEIKQKAPHTRKI